ncbi:MAG TPA: hypothetical protein VE173_13025 [Longimicrobiales bacterium]|nr:hypothetical protein [Longimicrobiales bacterium]
MTNLIRAGRRAPTTATAAALLLLLAGSACNTDSILEVPDPDVVSVPVFADPSNLAAVRAGVLREFSRALGGEQNNEGGQVLFSGLLADELYHSGTFTTRQEVDARDVKDTNASNATAFFWLQRARNHAEQGAELFAASDQAGSEEHAEIVALAGYTYILFGENYCSSVPFSKIPVQGGQTVYGPPRSTTEIFDLALERFDQAEGFQPGTDLVNMMRVGRGRALLDEGQYDAAAEAVSAVPTSFEFVTAYSEGNQNAFNAVWQLLNGERRWSASVGEGTNGLPFIVNDDPRTPGEFDGAGFRAGTDHYSQFKYPSAGTDIPLATGIEARLIEAEVALQGGDRSGFFALHNEIRATMDLPDLEDTGQSQAELVDLQFRERAYWLWLTSHRLGDLRRLVRQYGRPANTVYPIGPTEEGSARGDDLTLRVPFSETNNPNYDASACDPTMG